MTDKQDGVQRALGRIEGKLDSVIARIDKVDATIITHDDKINLLETFRDNLTGKISILGAIAGIIGFLITKVINYFVSRG